MEQTRLQPVVRVPSLLNRLLHRLPRKLLLAQHNKHLIWRSRLQILQTKRLITQWPH